MSNTKIEWTEKTWNPVTGCTKVSQGCKNCYAERMYERFNGKGTFKNVTCHQDRLSIPAKWRKPAVIFVNSMSDLFHDDVPFSFIYDVFLTMQKTERHTYQVLTKRPERMLEFFKHYAQIKEPLPNVWLGVSVENQKAANERIPFLVQIPAVVRFLSCEPLLGEVNLDQVSPGGLYLFNCLSEPILHKGYMPNAQGLINWVIVGGESGPGARPMHPEWVRKIMIQCSKADVPIFFKQWGEWTPYREIKYTGNNKSVRATMLRDVDGVCAEMSRLGKKKAGRLFHGFEYNGMPPV
jgi:protein gp37